MFCFKRKNRMTYDDFFFDLYYRWWLEKCSPQELQFINFHEHLHDGSIIDEEFFETWGEMINAILPPHLKLTGEI
ncbi:hypothetical protein DF947_10720 [Pedobacter paludis]|uniref:Uncharacterized protein n=1 Tax=Pedobacter paludis TaxID=2203212 RepID=A0A317F1U1_9SPHI|nr:hypothetical protein DF947_10720 [Pedobacter paludis]